MKTFLQAFSEFMEYSIISVSNLYRFQDTQVRVRLPFRLDSTCSILILSANGSHSQEICKRNSSCPVFISLWHGHFSDADKMM
jgi:hypothetical protein